ncbi:MAG: translocation/assembly module TamB domain-containing protein [Gammaproteobacteria bacterium]
MLFKRYLFWFIFTVFGLTAAYYIANTNTVLRWALYKLPNTITSNLIIDDIKGGLFEKIRLQGVSFNDKDISVNINEIIIEWNPVSLLFDIVEVSVFELSDIGISISKQFETNNAFVHGLDNIDLVAILPIEIKSGTIRKIRIKNNSNNKTQNINEIKFSAKKRNDKLHISNFKVTAPDYSINIVGDISSEPELSVNGLVDWEWNNFESLNYRGKASLKGDIALLQIDAELEHPESIQFSGVLKNVTTDFQWQGVLKTGNFNISQFFGDKKNKFDFVGLINGESNLEGNRDGITINNAVFYENKSKAKLQLQGKVSLQDNIWSFNGDSQWSNIKLPLTDDKFVFIPIAKLSGSISKNQYDLVLTESQVQYKKTIVNELRANVIGDYHKLEIKNIHSSVFNGTVSGDATIDWRSGLKWQSELAANNINPAAIKINELSSWPGNITFKLKSRGKASGDKIKTRLQITEVKGTLRQKQFTAYADFNINNDYYLINKMQMTLGDSKLVFSGSVGEKWNFNWNITNADLGIYDPQYSGRLNSLGSLTGARRKPVIKANLTSSKFQYGEQFIDSLSVDMNIDLADYKSSSIIAKADNIVYQNYQLDKLNFNASGKKLNHMVSITALMDENRLNFNFIGSINLNPKLKWFGEITSGSIKSDLVGSWELSPDKKITLSKTEFYFPDLCFQNKKSSWCVNSHWRKGGNLDSSIKFKDLPLSLFQGALNKQFELGGMLQGKAELHALNTKIQDAKISLTINDGYVDMILNKEATRLSSFKLATLSYQHNLNKIVSNVNLIFEGQEKLTAGIKLVAPDVNASVKNWPVIGYLKSDTQHPDFIRMLYTAIEEVKGNWKSDIALRGTLNNPIFSGYSKINSTLISIPTAGVKLSNISLNATSIANNEFELGGGFTSGKGTIKIDGNLITDPGKGWPAQLNVVGENIQVFNANESSVEISPILKLTKVAEKVNVKGIININKANIKARSALSQSVKISDDIVLVHKQETEEEKLLRKQSRWDFISNIKFVLGDQVYFDGYGISGRLIGSVDVKSEPGKITTGLGALHIKKGRYKFFGSVLNLDIGRLIFQNGPVANPSINARASKRSGDITAGVRLTGYLKSPEVSIYSIPSMPESEAVSYLLFGKIVTDNSFGLSNLTSSSGQNSGSDGVGLGDTLNPGSYINYAVGLLNSTSILRIRFELNKNWELYTESSVNKRGVEIFYTFEH